MRLVLIALAHFCALGIGDLASAQAPAPRTLAVRLTNEVETLDWNRSHIIRDEMVIRQLMDGLFRVTPRGKLQPDLCTRYTVSPDGLTYHFWIRPGVKWSDGVELTSGHFIASWKRLVNPLTAAENQYMLKGAEFRALNSAELEVKLAKSLSHFIWYMAQVGTFPMRQDVIEKYGNGWATPGRIVTLGAFQLESTTAGQEIVLKRNDRYWRKSAANGGGGGGNVERIIARVVKEDSTAENLFAVGKLDYFSDFSAPILKQHLKNPGLKWMDPFKVFYLGINPKFAPLLWPAVRQALAQGVDKNGFVRIFQGGQKAATTFVTPGVPGYFEDVGPKMDLNGARKLITQAKLTPGNRVIEMATLSTEKARLIGEYLQGEFARNLGIELRLKVYDSKTFYGLLGTRSFPLYVSGWGADFPDGDNFLQNFITGGQGGRSAYSSPEYDALMMKVRSTQDSRKRLAAMRAAQKLLLEKDFAVIPLFYDRVPVLLSPRVSGLELGPESTLRFSDVRVSARDSD